MLPHSWINSNFFHYILMEFPKENIKNALENVIFNFSFQRYVQCVGLCTNYPKGAKWHCIFIDLTLRGNLGVPFADISKYIKHCIKVKLLVSRPCLWNSKITRGNIFTLSSQNKNNLNKRQYLICRHLMSRMPSFRSSSGPGL